jgi:hypothetical protein
MVGVDDYCVKEPNSPIYSSLARRVRALIPRRRAEEGMDAVDFTRMFPTFSMLRLRYLKA